MVHAGGITRCKKINSYTDKNPEAQSAVSMSEGTYAHRAFLFHCPIKSTHREKNNISLPISIKLYSPTYIYYMRELLRVYLLFEIA